MRKSHGRTWNMERNTQKRANEKNTLQNLDYGEKPKKRAKCDTNTLGS